MVRKEWWLRVVEEPRLHIRLYWCLCCLCARGCGFRHVTTSERRLGSATVTLGMTKVELEGIVLELARGTLGKEIHRRFLTMDLT